MLAQFMQRVPVERRDDGVCPPLLAQPVEDTIMQERDNSQGTPPDQRDYGESGQYAGQGELNEGYGQGQEMAEDQWSGERYHQQAEQIDRDMLDQEEPRAGDISDVDQMVGGMTGVQQPPDIMSDVSEDEGGESQLDDWQS
jgi:hypothetical protein